jgi:hypothetical protein
VCLCLRLFKNEKGKSKNLTVITSEDIPGLRDAIRFHWDIYPSYSPGRFSQ